MTPHRLGNLAGLYESLQAVVDLVADGNVDAELLSLTQMKLPSAILEFRKGIAEFNLERGYASDAPVLLNQSYYIPVQDAILRIDTRKTPDVLTDKILVAVLPRFIPHVEAAINAAEMLCL